MYTAHTHTHPHRLPVNSVASAACRLRFFEYFFCFYSISQCLCNKHIGCWFLYQWLVPARCSMHDRGGGGGGGGVEKQWAGWISNGERFMDDCNCVHLHKILYFHGGSIAAAQLRVQANSMRANCNNNKRWRIADMMAIFKFAINAARTIIVPLMIERTNGPTNVNHISARWRRLATICIFLKRLGRWVAAHRFPIIS